MSEPEADWIDGIIPPARHWRVVYRYLGLADAVLHPSADACFAANAVCRRVYSRYPVDSAFHYRPLTKSDPGPLCPDLDADGAAGDFDNSNSIANTNASASGGHTESRTSYSDLGGSPDFLRPHDGGSRPDEEVLLADADSVSDSDTDTGNLRNPGSGDVLHEGR